MATTRKHIEMTRIDSSGNQEILYPKNTLADVHTNSTSGVTIEGKVMFYGTCSTAAATAAKVASATGFVLKAGAHVTVKFTNAITVASATLNVNSTGAKAIHYEGAALKANVIRAGASVEFVYDGTNYLVVAGVNPAYVENKNTTKFYLLGTPNNAAGMPSAEYFDTGVYVSTTSGQLVASSFSGNGSALTNLNASNIASGTLGAARLPSSGVTAGSYGPSADATVADSGSFTVPYVTVDAYGRVTSVKNITLTLTADNNTDTKVKNTLNTTAKAYITGTTSATTNTGTQVFDTGVYLDTTAGRLTSSSLLTGTCYLGSSTSNYINGTNYTGTAAKVGTLSGWLVDSCASASANGVTNKALTANQGYLLQNQIDTLNSNIETLTTTVNGKANSSHTHSYLPLSGGTMTGSIAAQAIYPKTNLGYNLGTTSYIWATTYSKAYDVYNSDGASYGKFYISTAGTTSAVGTAYLLLGNGTASGTAKNARGYIRMYGSSSGYTQIQTGNNSTSNITLTLPDTTGTIPIVSLSGTVLTITT